MCDTMDVIELVKTINDSGLSLDDARKEGLLPANVKAVRKLLKENGYDYDRAAKQWRTGVTVPTTKEQATKEQTANTVVFTVEEINALKQIAYEVTQGNTSITATTSGNTKERHVTQASADITLYERSKLLTKGNTIRKTYVINSEVADLFDSLSDRCNIDKSQLLTLALIDFLEKYNA